jgi:FkbM family methyltransferase
VFRPFFHDKQKKIYLRLLKSKFPELKPTTESVLVLDLGANLGHFSAAVLDLGFEVKAVEPHPIAYRYLESRFKKHPKVTLINGAIAANESTVTLSVHPDHSKDPLVTSLSASLIDSKFKSNHEKFEVDAYLFGEFFKEGEFYELVKIDIEGAEVFLFSQLMEHASQIKRVLLETHSRFMSQSEFAEEYNAKLSELEDFIIKNNLGSLWFTDWI